MAFASLLPYNGKPNVLQQHSLPQISSVSTYGNAPPSTSGLVDPNGALVKIDLHLNPMLTLLYLLSFLDHGNIGNAKIKGLSKDIHMTGQQCNLTLTVFIFTYCIFEVCFSSGYDQAYGYQVS